ncbi:response regulator [Gloeocapsa sp. PCC 73106]|uniref:response regulator n=1 Tax=Gloeocapsa sp. PCC 73106 TaxID=102232 RepID=UPI0002ABEAE8|nr:response regulator [Gloeocapsa sp. PCC 73106]ELR96846.1 response regulator containing a CheY-like receiver domain and a GGDEF domain [Gloeocapsa sp. PCC 73106]
MLAVNNYSSMHLSYTQETLEQNVSIITILRRIVETKSTGYLRINWQGIRWAVYLSQGNIIYCTNSLKPEEKIERHLRYFSKHNTDVTSANIAKARLLLLKNIKQDSYNPEYQVLYWLYQQKILPPTQSYSLIFRLVQESLESLLLVTRNDYTWQYEESQAVEPILIRFFLSNLLGKTEERLKSWRELTPEIESTYQSPYISREEHPNPKLLEETRRKYGKILVGCNFRQLGARLAQDELVVAQKIHPLILQGLVKLNAPESPFNQLPSLLIPVASADNEKLILCVDDSLTVIKVINHYLSSLKLKIHAVTESPKALMEIIRLKPNLILLDIGMPDLDGYRLCSLIRNHSALSEIPIIMVTGKNGLIDRAKAKISGATDYLTKPFSQDKLNEIVVKYLKQ